LDKKNKLDNFEEKLKEIAGTSFKFNPEIDEETQAIIDLLKKRGISNIDFDPYMIRGFDYYNGLIFEIFDTSPSNNRSVFGGGRYDNLTQIFSNDNVPAIGFGMGDVTLQDVLETYDLLPSFETRTDVYLATMHENFNESAMTLADDLRKTDLKIIVDFSNKKIGDHVKKAISRGAKYFAVLGDDEIYSQKLTLKHLATKKEKKLKFKNISKFVKKNY
jgi:histidyl-tRNA synthetase